MIRLMKDVRPLCQANLLERRRGFDPMSERILSLEINKQICDAVGCSATATEEIKVSVGQLGDIHLSVCTNCRPKFSAPPTGSLNNL